MIKFQNLIFSIILLLLSFPVFGQGKDVYLRDFFLYPYKEVISKEYEITLNAGTTYRFALYERKCKQASLNNFGEYTDKACLSLIEKQTNTIINSTCREDTCVSDFLFVCPEKTNYTVKIEAKTNYKNCYMGVLFFVQKNE